MPVCNGKFIYYGGSESDNRKETFSPLYFNRRERTVGLVQGMVIITSCFLLSPTSLSAQGGGSAMNEAAVEYLDRS